MMMEFVTVFFPLWEAYEARFQRKVTLSALQEWEKNRTDNGSLGSDSLKQSFSQSERQEKRDMYSMQSLEKTLANDSTDLLQFAATKEFTGENIVFLTQVRDWKRAWDSVSGGKEGMSLESKRKLYNNAAEIFFSSVCLQTAQFPVNIESKIYFALEQLFRSESCPMQKATATPFADDATTYFNYPQQKSKLPSSSVPSAKDEEAGIVGYPFSIGSNIPAAFDGTVFDRAEASVKYMVFTNTWVRYVWIILSFPVSCELLIKVDY